MTTATRRRLPVGTKVFGGDREVRGCTGRQEAFINTLLDQREYSSKVMFDLTGIYDPQNASEINIRAASDVISYLKMCPQRITYVDPRPATEAQQRKILQEAAGREGGMALVATVDLGALSLTTASALIGSLLALPVRVVAPLQVGAYKAGETFYSVRTGRQSRALYAMRWTGAGWVYERGAVRLLQPEQRLSLAEAKAFGVMTGECICCHATLTDPKSVVAGIGPVCAKKY